MSKIITNDQDEPLRRYYEAWGILKRMIAAYEREAWNHGEQLHNVVSDAREWMSYEVLEDEIFSGAVVPVSNRATGRTIADLTGIEHVCEYQKAIESAASHTQAPQEPNE